MPKPETKKVMDMPILKAIREKYGDKPAAVLHILLAEQKRSERENTLLKVENKYWFEFHQRSLIFDLDACESTVCKCVRVLEEKGVLTTRRDNIDKRHKLFWINEAKI